MPNDAEIRLFSAYGVKTVVADLLPRFEAETGHRVAVTLGEAGEQRHRILEGAGFDLAFLPPATLNELAAAGKIAGSAIRDICRTEVGMAVRPGASPPEAGSAAALARLLLAARSIVVTDPASGGVSGVHFAQMIDRLGIADALGPKLRLTRGVFNAELVARGEADLAVQLAHEIRLVPGVAFVALPEVFRRTITFSAALAGAAGEGARELLRFLGSPAAAQAIAARGMQPVADPRGR